MFDRSFRRTRGEQGRGHCARRFAMAGLGPGDFFGEMALIEMQNRSATVVAESPAVLYELTARNLYTLPQLRRPRVCHRDAEHQPRTLPRLRRADDRIAKLIIQGNGTA